MNNSIENDKNNIESDVRARVDAPFNNDYFGIGNYIRGISDFIKTTPTPMTIALQGDWGSGKSTILNLIEKELNLSVYWFNAWEYSQFNGNENLSIMFLNYLINAITGKDEKEKNKDVKNIISSIVKFSISCISNGSSKGEFVDDFFKSGDKDIYASLKEKLRKIISDKIKNENNDKLVIFIDDLDRLEPQKAVEMLEVMKNFLDFEGIVFVLAIDSEIVESGIKKKYLDIDDDKASKFFEKIIQVPFRVPIEKYNVNYDNFLRKLFESFSDKSFNIKDIENDCISYIKLSIGSNPRAIKRLLNLFYLHWCISKRNIEDKEKNRENRKKLLLFVVLCLQTTYSSIYDVLIDKVEYNNEYNSGIAEEILQDEDNEKINEFIKKMDDHVKNFETEFKEILGESVISETHSYMIKEIPGNLKKYSEKLIEVVASLGFSIRFNSKLEGNINQKRNRIRDVFPVIGIKKNQAYIGFYIDCGVGLKIDKKNKKDEIKRANQSIYDLLINDGEEKIRLLKEKHGIEINEQKERGNNKDIRYCRYICSINDIDYDNEKQWESQHIFLSKGIIELNEMMNKYFDQIILIINNI